MRGNNSPGKVGWEGYTTTVLQLQHLSPGAGAVVRTTPGVTAASEPPASAMGCGGSQICTCSASRKMVFPCRNHLPQIVISAQGLPSQTKKLSLKWDYSLWERRKLSSGLDSIVSHFLFPAFSASQSFGWGGGGRLAELSCKGRGDVPPLGAGHTYLGVSLIANMELLNRSWSSPQSKNNPWKENNATPLSWAGSSLPSSDCWASGMRWHLVNHGSSHCRKGLGSCEALRKHDGHNCKGW